MDEIFLSLCDKTCAAALPWAEAGYRCDTYDKAADDCGWRRIEFDLPNNSASGASKERKTECVWCNF